MKRMLIVKGRFDTYRLVLEEDGFSWAKPFIQVQKKFLWFSYWSTVYKNTRAYGRGLVKRMTPLAMKEWFIMEVLKYEKNIEMNQEFMKAWDQDTEFIK